ncbi:two-component system response regulator KdpE [Sulfuricaulis sp.]|jgi:two-component system KDP operon response regulator KdpE|uniref:two-component system response regulator KdpE n=1 Tax=Sulfuricaulis sp. TaxID=2003553 RepID=UPI003559F1E5
MTPHQPVAIIAEDEKQIRRFLRTSLEAEGFIVHEAETGKQALVEAATRKPDILILDLGLPDMDGVNVIRDIRSWTALPIVVLSARTQESDKIDALDAGADDYLTKPFGVGELMARVRVVLRRRATVDADGKENREFRFGDVRVDLINRQIYRAEQQIHLTAIEYRLLTVLIRNAGKVHTHRQLLKEVWGPSHVEDSHYLRTYMAHLRQKLESDPAQPRHLITETGVGYRLVE